MFLYEEGILDDRDFERNLNNQIDKIDDLLDKLKSGNNIGMLNSLSEGVFDFLKTNDQDKIKKHTINLLKKHKKNVTYIQSKQNTKEAKLVKKKTAPIIKEKVRYFTSTYKDKDLSNEAVQKQFSKDISDSIKEVLTVDFTDFDGLTEALLVTMLVATINTLILSILLPFFGPMGAMIITAVFIAPITEEFAKNYEKKQDNAGNFVFVFNAYEFLSYVLGGRATILQRIPAIILHYTTMLVQTHIINKDENNDKGAFAAGAIIHGLFNAVASLT